jgi:hypothetical protein
MACIENDSVVGVNRTTLNHVFWKTVQSDLGQDSIEPSTGSSMDCLMRGGFLEHSAFTCPMNLLMSASPVQDGKLPLAAEVVFTDASWG